MPSLDYTDHLPSPMLRRVRQLSRRTRRRTWVAQRVAGVRHFAAWLMRSAVYVVAVSIAFVWLPALLWWAVASWWLR